MDLNDILSGGHEYVATNRPKSPDMDRIMEIVLAMKAEIQEPTQDRAAAWRKRIDDVIDFDALAWQAIQVATQLSGITTGLELMLVRQSEELNGHYLALIQAFYDGFLLGAEFQIKGGHRA